MAIELTITDPVNLYDRGLLLLKVPDRQYGYSEPHIAQLFGATLLPTT